MKNYMLNIYCQSQVVPLKNFEIHTKLTFIFSLNASLFLGNNSKILSEYDIETF